MSYAHLIFGLITFVVFLVTGKLMRWDFPDKEIIPPEFRILMRSRHIYILISAFAHILLGLYLEIYRETWRKYLQLAGSVLLFTGTGLLVAAFFYETYTTQHFSDVSRNGLYMTLAGTIFHLFGGFKIRNKKI